MSVKEPIRFDCPKCGAHHERGYFDGVGLFRCLGCGYVGYGWHPDPEIDREVQQDIDEANAVNRALGLPLDERP